MSEFRRSGRQVFEASQRVLRGGFEKVVAVTQDLRDHLPSREAPEIQIESAIARRFREELLPSAWVARARQKTEGWSDGTRRYVFGAGRVQDRTRHAHAFEVERRGEATQFRFLDPEYRVAKNNPWRPAILNLDVMDMRADGTVGLHILRADFGPAQAGVALGADPYLVDRLDHVALMARALPDHLPEVYRNAPEHIGFSLSLDDDGARIRSRYEAPDRLAERLQRGQRTFSTHAKFAAHLHVFRRLLEALEHPERFRAIE